MISGLVVFGIVGRRGRRVLTGLGGQRRQIELRFGQAAGQVRLHRFAGGGHLGLHVAQVEQHARHLLGGVGGHARFLDRVDDDVVVTHQTGPAGPADQRVRQADALRPRGLGLPTGHDRVERGLGLAVGAVAAEHPAVRGSRQHHVQPGRDVPVRADVRQPADEPLHGPQQHLHLHLGPRARVGEVSADPRSGEREQQRRGQRVLEVDRLGPEALGLFGADPLDECVDVVVGGHVRRQHPQLRPEPGVVAVELTVERQPGVVELGRGGHHRRPAVEQLRDDRRGDRTLRRTRDHGDLVVVAAGGGILRTRGGTRVERGVHVAARGQCLALPVGGLGAHHVAGALEAFRQADPVGFDVPFVHQPDPDQVLTGAGPPVVEQHGLATVEHRSHQTRPVRTEFGRDQIDELGIGRGVGGDERCAETQLVEDGAGRRGEHAVGSGDLLGEFAEGGGVHHPACGAGRRRQRHRDTPAGSDSTDRGVDRLVHRGRVGQRAVMQSAQCSPTDTGPLTGAESDLDGDVLDPALAELPGLLDPLADVGRPLPGRSEDRAHLIVDRVRQHRAERLVGAGQLGDLRLQPGQIGLCGAVDGAEVQLGTRGRPASGYAARTHRR